MKPFLLIALLVFGLLIAAAIANRHQRAAPVQPALQPEVMPVEQPPPLPQSANDMVATACKYEASYADRNIDQLEVDWRGRQVTWTGKVKTLHATGTSFIMMPLIGEYQNFNCMVMNFDHEFCKNLKVGQVVTVSGKLSEVSILGVSISGRK